MERITLEVDEDAGKKWRSASPQLKSDLLKSILLKSLWLTK